MAVSQWRGGESGMRLMSSWSQSGVEDLEDSWRAADLQTMLESQANLLLFPFIWAATRRCCPEKVGFTASNNLTKKVPHRATQQLVFCLIPDVDNQNWASQ